MLFNMGKKDIENRLIELHSKKDIDFWCRKLNCSESMLRFCVNSVGRSYKSVDAFLYMNRDWLSMRTDLMRVTPLKSA